MVFKSIYSDTYYTTTADTFYYRIELDGSVIYSGKAVKMPNADEIRININKICSNYLSNDLDEMINPMLFGSSALDRIENPLAIRTFDLINARTEQVVEQYTFLLDWNYVELWTGQLQNRWYESGNTDSEIIIVTPSQTSVPSTGSVVSVNVQYVNGDNNLTATTTGGAVVESMTWNGDNATVVIRVPENNTGNDKNYTVTFTGDGVSQSLNITQSATDTVITVNPTSINYEIDGGVQYITMTTNKNWTSSFPSWLTVSAVDVNTGDNVNTQAGSAGSYRFTIVANPNSGTQKSGNIVFTANDRTATVSVMQTGSGAYIIVPSEKRLDNNSGTTATIDVLSNTAWTATTVASWITITEQTGSGNGTISFSVSDNTSYGDRSAAIRIKAVDNSVEQLVYIIQPAREYINITPSNVRSNGTGITNTTVFTVSANTSWTASTDADWITLTQTTGSGVVGIVAIYPANDSSEDRVAHITVTNGNITGTAQLTQRHIVHTSISPTVLTFNVTGGSQTVTVTSDGDWTVSSIASWITASTTTGSGNGTVTFTVGNTTDERSDNITIGGKTLQIRQTTLDVYPEGISFEKEGGNGSFSVITDTAWTATTDVDWITLSPTTGSGNGTISITVPANTGDSRGANITVTNGKTTKTVGVSQMRYYYIDATITVTTTPSDADWMPSVEESWLTVSPSGWSTGNGTVTVTAAANTGAARDAQITIMDSSITVRQSAATTDYSSEYLTFEMLSDGIINWYTSLSDSTQTIEYNKNNTGWNSISSSTGGTVINVVSGDTVQFRGDNANYISHFTNSTGRFKVYGNIMSLIDSTNFASLTTFTKDSPLPSMFEGCTGLTDASNLILPATTLTYYCYGRMFNSCTSLTTAPVLPATTLASNCYSEMFMRCASLIQAPALPTTTLANVCYSGMFIGCTSLTQAPELPATTLAPYCYEVMFGGCTGLTTAPVLPATTLAEYCYSQMFEGCSRLTTAPNLPATTLQPYCYNRMFYSCSNLNYIKCLITNIPTTGSYTNNWVNGVASSGTFVKDSNATWSTGTSGIPTGWTVQNV